MEIKQLDKLDVIFEMQRELQVNLNQYTYGEFAQNKIDKTILCIIDELFEFLRETKYKYWRKQKQININKLKMEYIDIFKFVLNLGLLVNINSEELFDLFIEKTKINYERIGEENEGNI